MNRNKYSNEIKQVKINEQQKDNTKGKLTNDNA